MFLRKENQNDARSFFHQLIDIGLRFKGQKQVKTAHMDIEKGCNLLEAMPDEGLSLEQILREFEEKYLPFCSNFGSTQFMGFPDAGNSVAGIGGAILADFLQQNLINQSFCGPSATFLEINVIRWLREIVGYTNGEVNELTDTGGIITGGGTMSNATAILLSRENKFPGAMEYGMAISPESFIVVPKGVSHYSVKSAQMLLGMGHRLLEVETRDFRYDLEDLERVVTAYQGRISTLIAYAGDSRSMTIDNFAAIYDIVKGIDPSIRLHADACHGFCLGCSQSLRSKIAGIELFDSITTDPHKVFNLPYVISALLLKTPSDIKKVTSISDLIMQEPFSFGQVTPFIGSKQWLSLKLRFFIKNLGKKGLDKLITERHQLACMLEGKLRADPNFVVLNKVAFNAVMFMFTGGDTSLSLQELNELNKAIYERILQGGQYYLHKFSIPDNGIFEKGALIYPLRFMSGNPNVTPADLDEMIAYVTRVGKALLPVATGVV